MDFTPPPLFPALINRPLGLVKTDDTHTKIFIKKRFKESIKNSSYYVITKDTEKSNFNATIQRFSDRYSKQKLNFTSNYTPDWSRLPKELKFFYANQALTKKTHNKQNTAKHGVKKKEVKKVDLKKFVNPKGFDGDETLNEDDLAEDENDEKELNDNKDDKKEVDGGEQEGENEGKDDELENVDDEEIEEENDYLDAYFDNGENDYDDDNGLGGGDDDGATY